MVEEDQKLYYKTNPVLWFWMLG